MATNSFALSKNPSFSSEHDIKSDPVNKPSTHDLQIWIYKLFPDPLNYPEERLISIDTKELDIKTRIIKDNTIIPPKWLWDFSVIINIKNKTIFRCITRSTNGDKRNGFDRNIYLPFYIDFNF
ncbi:hypothetical protein PHYBLDRAFT_162961 [Phycomyces blakesleeanus NRRL 1555(-)]|uniref:Uncharacterized protein n=1 Tax=Phycomyces blakesleeanus (strain ATCC 8743b / DSM 1359 / FGSC 10004 / NBRC 33097 / NRRL 1555) TaxID=763407 RepID=A0A167QM49_PHYB8|nr:hypothetical protein PHYBLDRAFT_162961 [Phycomyces blakesleeanus NRRL 1555(-)]OAD79909.1 hypothetical protein PHYBLDRAFT_162961 [Phycomyces blakesleeanus NRRL 1555(-)]|eukprot:XP_018297949.1 hypothetical protein PHYBLDRAFT_162961 [Phycomyces blakesleeanus NRRL 1555(-)]